MHSSSKTCNIAAPHWPIRRAALDAFDVRWNRREVDNALDGLIGWLSDDGAPERDV